MGVGIAAGIIANYALHSYGDMVAQLPLENRVAVALYGLAFYVWKTFIPVLIAPVYQLPAHLDPLDGPMLTSALGVIGLTGVLVSLRRLWPAGLAVWTSYVVVVPVSWIVQSGPQFVAARYSYLSGLGLALLVAGAVCRVAGWATERRRRRPWAQTALASGYLGLALLTWQLVWVWRDSETLWTYAVSLEPASPLARGNLGFAYLNRGRLLEAERDLVLGICEIDMAMDSGYVQESRGRAVHCPRS